MAYHLVTHGRESLHSFASPLPRFFVHLICYHPLFYCSCVVTELDFVFANTFCALLLPSYQMGGVMDK